MMNQSEQQKKDHVTITTIYPIYTSTEKVHTTQEETTTKIICTNT